MASTEHVPSFAHLEFDTPLYRTAIAQFDQAVPHANVDDGVAERLRHPERSIIVACPVKLDDGRRVVFPGYRVQHSSVLGPTKGGIRYDPEVSLGERGARRLDDLEVRVAAPAVRRGEGRRPLQPARDVVG